MIGLGQYNPETGAVTRSKHEIHGTNDENSIGEMASSGCMRMLNEAVKDLTQRVTVVEIVYVKHEE